MVNDKERLVAVKKMLDERIRIQKEKDIEINQLAEKFFEENKEDFVYNALDTFIYELELSNSASTDFYYFHDYEDNIRGKSADFTKTYLCRLCELIKNNLRELSPDFCEYNVEIEKNEDILLADSLFLTITMNIKY